MRTVVFKVLDTLQIAKEHTQKSESDVGISKNPHNTFVIHIAALGFKKHNVRLSVNGHDLNVNGRASTILGPEAINGVEKIDDHIFFDANKVSADLVDGYLVVRIPLVTKSTMVEGEFDVKWAEKSEDKSADDDRPQEIVDVVELIRPLLEDVRVIKAAAVAADYIELSHLLNLLDFSSPLIAPLFTKSAQPNIIVKALKNGLLITVDAVGFTQESDLQIKMEHGCVVIKGEASTVKGDKVVTKV